MAARLDERCCAYTREGKILTNLSPKDPIANKEAILSHKTVTVTQSLKTDIIQFLISKYTSDATISVAEVMSMYKCPEDRAKRVLDALIKDGVLALTGGNSYKVII